MESEPRGAAGGVSRRDVLRRGAVVGGTLAWSVPVIQTVGMRAAGAQESPAGACTREWVVTLEAGGTATCWTDDCGKTWTCTD